MAWLGGPIVSEAPSALGSLTINVWKKVVLKALGRKSPTRNNFRVGPTLNIYTLWGEIRVLGTAERQLPELVVTSSGSW
jgi:hypothetical protein